MNGGVQRIWGSRNYDVPAAGLQLGGGGAGGGAGGAPPSQAGAGAAHLTPPLKASGAASDAGALGGDAYTPAKALAELVALNPHASAIGLRAQVREVSV